MHINEFNTAKLAMTAIDEVLYMFDGHAVTMLYPQRCVGLRPNCSDLAEITR